MCIHTVTESHPFIHTAWHCRWYPTNCGFCGGWASVMIRSSPVIQYHALHSNSSLLHTKWFVLPWEAEFVPIRWLWFMHCCWCPSSGRELVWFRYHHLLWYLLTTTFHQCRSKWTGITIIFSMLSIVSMICCSCVFMQCDIHYAQLPQSLWKVCQVPETPAACKVVLVPAMLVCKPLLQCYYELLINYFIIDGAVLTPCLLEMLRFVGRVILMLVWL